MTSADVYRVKAADLIAKARQETNPKIRGELDTLALSYLRLAEQASRNSRIDLVYEAPAAKAEQPNVQQQQQIQSNKDDG